jgi:DNA uptake protein ComE-like DNA-binding protein
MKRISFKLLGERYDNVMHSGDENAMIANILGKRFTLGSPDIAVISNEPWVDAPIPELTAEEKAARDKNIEDRKKSLAAQAVKTYPCVARIETLEKLCIELTKKVNELETKISELTGAAINPPAPIQNALPPIIVTVQPPTVLPPVQTTPVIAPVQTAPLPIPQVQVLPTTTTVLSPLKPAVNVNTADAKALEALPHIGAIGALNVIKKRIVAGVFTPYKDHADFKIRTGYDFTIEVEKPLITF